METEEPALPPPTTLTKLIVSLEQATLMAKQLPATTDQSNLLQIYSSLQQTHLHLSSFLSSVTPATTQFPPAPPFPAAENSLSSDIGFDNGDGEPMQVGDDDDDNEAEAENDENSASRSMIDKVEERMRDCFIKNKRPKRQLSPLSMGEERRLYDDRFAGEVNGFDPHWTKLRALDLVYQFHG